MNLKIYLDIDNDLKLSRYIYKHYKRGEEI